MSATAETAEAAISHAPDRHRPPPAPRRRQPGARGPSDARRALAFPTGDVESAISEEDYENAAVTLSLTFDIRAAGDRPAGDTMAPPMT